MADFMRVAAAVLFLILISVDGNAYAQGVRPSDERPELPGFPEEEPEPSLLPPLPAPPAEEEDRLSSGRRVFVKQFEVQGSTVFPEEELARVTAPWEGREISSTELGQVRNAITRLYVDAGYVTSGAVIADQPVTDGVVVIQAVEGTLEDIAIEGNRHLRPGYIRSRIELGVGTPVNVYELEKRLQLLQQQNLIRRIDAQLDPGLRRGESTLSVLVDEGRPARMMLGAANDQSPTVGSEGGHVDAAYLSVTGNGDVFSSRGELTEGYTDLDLHYSLPLNAHDTTLRLNYRRTTGEVVESPFDDLDIDSTVQTYGVTLSHPLIRDLDRELWLGITGEYRESETDWEFGDFPSTPGSDDGEISISVLRLFQEWTTRSPTRVMAARSTLSFGLDIFGATTNSGRVPDSRFVAWLAQIQLAQRLPRRYLDSQLIFRTDLQLASDSMLSLEQYSLGGMHTVRGYRENQLVRDNGWSSSLELRIPVLTDLLGRDVLQLAPFFDLGQARNKYHNSGPETLASLGAGLRYQLSERILAQIYWGGRLRHVKRHGNDIQNNGFHWDVEVAAW